MALSNDLISQFVKATRDKEETSNESTAYGKIVVHDGKEYVQLDGSELLTPISSTTVVKDGDRVIVTIKDHSAIVTGDFTNPSANNKDVVEIGNKITEFEIVIADKISTEQLEAEIARIEQLRAKDLEATNAKIETLEAKTAKIDKIEADQVEISGKVEAHEAEFTTLRADIADFKDVTAESVKAVEGKFNTLEADYTSFEETTTNKLTAYEADIKDLEADMLTAEKADLKYANIDFSNIKEAAIEKLFTDSGIIKDLIMSNGKVTGELVGVTIKGDLIEGNTVKADKLVILGEDGLYYKLNVDALGETTASADPKYQNGLDGSVIIAESITAEKITVDDLVAFGATIGGFNINDHAIYSGAKSGINSNNEGVFIGDDGQINIGDTNQYLKYFKDSDGNYKLEILADSLKFGANKTTIEEYIESKTENISTIKEAEGSELYISDGQQLIEFRIDGKSEQETRSGNNILEFENVETVLSDVNVVRKDGIITLSGTATNHGAVNLGTYTLPAGTYYQCANGSDNFTNYSVIRSIVDGSVLLAVDGSFTLTEETKVLFQIYFNSRFTGTYTYKPIVNKGDISLPWELGGVSPSPDYPSEIKSLGYTNLFNGNVYTYTNDHNSGLISRETDKWEVGSVGNWARIKVTITDLKPNTNYVISSNIDKSKMSQETSSGFYSTGNYQSNGLLLKGTLQGNVHYKFTSNETGSFEIQFYTNYTGDTITGSVIYSDIRITEDIIRPYVPYGKYGIEFVYTGKNLFNDSNAINGFPNLTMNDTLSYTSSDKTISYERCCRVKAGKKYTISYKKNTPVSTSARGGVIVDDNNIVIQTYGAWSNSSDSITFTAEHDGWLVFPSDKNTTDIQIEVGSIATEKEPYRGKTIILELNEPLRSLPNGVEDIAYIKQGKLYVDRKVGSIIFDGSENWETQWNSSSEVIYGWRISLENGIIYPNDMINPNPLMSDRFKNYGQNSLFSNKGIGYSGICGRANTNAIIIMNNDITSKDDFKTWLSENPTQVNYELAEPITEEIGYVDLSMTENSVNDYSVNDPMSPNLYCKYYKDGVLIDDTIAEEFKNINNNLINNYYTKTETDAQLKIKTDSITASVSEIKKQQENTDSSVEALDKDIVELSKTVSAKMTSEEVTIAIQNELANGVSHVKTSTGFTFNEEGLTVSKDGRDMKTTINEDGMIIKSVNAILEEEDKLIANSDGVFAYDLRAKTYLIIGANSRFEDYEKNGKKQTGCFWIGDTEV